MRPLLSPSSDGLAVPARRQCIQSETFLWYAAEPGKDGLRFYWKDGRGIPFRNMGNPKAYLGARGERLVFAMNGGMLRNPRGTEA